MPKPLATHTYSIAAMLDRVCHIAAQLQSQAMFSATYNMTMTVFTDSANGYGM